MGRFLAVDMAEGSQVSVPRLPSWTPRPNLLESFTSLLVGDSFEALTFVPPPPKQIERQRQIAITNMNGGSRRPGPGETSAPPVQ